MKQIMQANHDKLINNCLIILSFLGLSFLFMGGCYYKTMQSQQMIVSQNNDQNRLNNLADEVQRNLLEVNNDIKNFELANNSQDLMKIDEKNSSTRKKLLEIGKLVSSDEDKMFIDAMEKIVAQYQNDFYTVTKATTELGITEKMGLLSQFNQKMQTVSNIVINSKDSQLKEKFLIMQTLQKNYLEPDDNKKTSAEQVIIAQKNFLDRVNRSAIDYEILSKMLAQTISLMQSFDLVKNAVEQKRIFSKKTTEDQLQLQEKLKKFSEISHEREKQIRHLIEDTEQQNFFLFLISIGLVTLGFIISVFMLTLSHTDNISMNTEDDFLQKMDMKYIE